MRPAAARAAARAALPRGCGPALALARAASSSVPPPAAAAAAAAATTQPVQYTGGGVLDDVAVAKVGVADGALRAAYDAMPKSYPAHAQADEGAPIDAHSAFRKRLLYRSKQRGW